VATKRQVEAKLRELMSRLAASEDARGSLADSLPVARVIAVSVPDLGGEYWTVMSEGRMDGLHRGSLERADIRVRVESDDLVDLVDGKRSLFSSFIGGRVKVDASVSDLLRLRKLT